MQNTSRVPAELCKAERAEVIQTSNIAFCQKWGSRNSPLKRTLDSFPSKLEAAVQATSLVFKEKQELNVINYILGPFTNK